MKQPPEGAELITLSVRVPRETADRLRTIADREFRPVAAELRRMIQERVDDDDAEMRAAA
jgi:predicted DNA-binding protein